MAAIGNALGGDFLRQLFVTSGFQRALRPPIGVEEFNAFPRGCTVAGTAGNDHLVGTAGDDVLCGEGGDDVIDGGDGADVLSAGPGDDTLRGGPGGDHLEGGDGTNRCPDLATGDTANAC
jgi:Ca2+-binding RTX toxin-like protein